MNPPAVALLFRLGLLLSVCAYALTAEVRPLPTLAAATGVTFLLWLALAWRRLAIIPRLTVAVALSLTAYIWWCGGFTGALLTRAIGRAAFFTWFLLAMDILRSAASRSEMVLSSGQALVHQPPGRRYIMLTLGSHLLAMLLNMGALTLLGTMTKRSIEQQSPADTARRNEIRLRRMILGTSRGFAAFTLWAPTSVTVLVMLAALPDLNWHQFALQGVMTAAAFMTLGWLVDRLSYPVLPAQPGPERSPARLVRALLPLSLLTVAILCAGLILAQVSGLRLIAALLISMPTFGLGWIIFQYNRAGPVLALRLGARRICRQVLPEATTLHNEIAIIASAGFIAVILPQLIDAAALGQLIIRTDLSGGLVLTLLVWVIALSSVIGLNPIITVSIGLELLSQVPGFDATPQMLALAGTMGWAMATGMSPLGASMRLTGRCIGRSPAEIGLVWNRRFTMVAGCAVSTFLILFA